MPQRGTVRHRDVVDQMPVPRELTVLPHGRPLGFKMPRIPARDVHAVRALPLVVLDAVPFEIRGCGVDRLGRDVMPEQYPPVDVRLRSGHRDHAVESEIENAAFDLRHRASGADEQLVAARPGRLACLLRGDRHFMPFVGQCAIDIEKHQFAGHCHPSRAFSRRFRCTSVGLRAVLHSARPGTARLGTAPPAHGPRPTCALPWTGRWTWSGIGSP